ncbi:OLC1v1008305C1 [Oldenlandia corymbosa var. corymbosa]|uniref:OLC1v1008305C1 n=1 Tax=Oldenlandia corymbosa var. corymbosa TaxID=529605 RepID=A0AAV1DMS8_OLDCO|nr:OLC1v1008305C1 [Oldenlandia corymbosa var. corymbosa]
MTEKMVWNGPYFINVYWRNKYVVEDGTIRTFDNRADATLVVERKLSYSEFLGRICDKAGWDRNYVNLRINLLFENNGVRRSATITDDSSVKIIYYFSGSSYLELYVENEDTVHAQNLLDLSGQKQDVTFVSQQHQQYWMNNSQHAEAGPSRSGGDGYITEGHGGGQNDDYDSSDEDDASDRTYVESEEEVDYQTDVDEVEAAIEDWNIYHNRQFYVLASGRKTWAAEYATRRMQTPIGQSTCAWRMHASLKQNGLWQIVSWVVRHNCVGITRQNDHRNLRSKLIARLIMRSVENDPAFKVKSIRDDVKEAYKVDVKYKKAWHARRKAIEACYGLAYMMAIPRGRWSLAYDQDYARWGMLTTNISESYNNVLKGVRFLSSRAVVESTLAKTIKFFCDQYADALKCNTPIGDKYWKKFCKYENTAATHKVELYDCQNQVYEVITGWRHIGKGGNEHKEEYRDWCCSCKKWQTYRLPCSHALAVCRWIGDHSENIIHEYYKTSTWREKFCHSRFVPVPRREEWVSPGWNFVPDYVNLVLYNAVGRQQQWRFLMSMDYMGRGGCRRCRRCGSRDHLTSLCSFNLTCVRLQIWAYERIPRIRPMRKNLENDDHTLALGSRWRCSLDFSQVASHCLPAQRDQLASLRKVEDFIWQPYEGVEIPERCTRGRDHWQSNTWLICWDIVEPHQVDRVMRQFGLKQLIPPQPMIAGFEEWEKLHKYGRTGRAGNNWEFHHREYIEKWNNRVDFIVAGSPSGQSSTDDDYLPWQKIIEEEEPQDDRGIGGARQKIKEEGEPEFDFELNADLFQTPTPQNQDEANQEGESTNLDVDVDVESSLPLALARPRRKIKKVNRYTPSTAQPEPLLEEEEL